MRWLPYVIVLSIVAIWIGASWFSYRHVIADLLHQWQVNPSYSHGPIVVPIAIWLLWTRRSSRPSVSRPWRGGFGLLLAAHLMLWLGAYFYLPAVERWSAPLWLAAVVGLLCGRRVLVWALPGIGLLAFMIPLPFQLESLANQLLQWASAWCSCLLLGLTSTVAVTDGYTLRMATGRVGITTDCSGLRMTIAIAAVSYILTFVRQSRTHDDRRGGGNPWGIAARLGMMVLLVIPAAILANAVRITAMAWVMNRFQVESYTAWAHDLGDWLVLPVAAAAFLVCRAWLSKVVRVGRAEVGPDRCDQRGGTAGRRRSVRTTTWIPVAAPPAAMIALAGFSIWHYQEQREQFAAQMMNEARDYEAASNWDRAAECYRELAHWHSSPVDAHFRHVRVALQSANSRDDREQALLRLEGILQQSPLHLDALRTHLDLALKLGEADAAVRTAERLYLIDHHDETTMQMCVETRLRFPSRPSRLPDLSAGSLSDWAQRLGPVSTWRDSLVIEIAAFCSQHPESVELALKTVLHPAITSAADRTGTAKAHFESWRFERVVGKRSASLERALKCIGEDCPQNVAYEIYFAAAESAWQEHKFDRAKQLVTEAVERIPTDHRGFELLGDVHQSQRELLPCTAAYLRAWRLAGNRPLELGIKLAESLIRIDAHSATASLADSLVDQVNDAVTPPDRTLRIRLQLVQSQLDLRQERYEESLHRLESCQALLTLVGAEVDPVYELLATIEKLTAQCLVRLGRYTDAARLFEERAVRAASSADQWKAAARAWRKSGNVSAAERCYRRAVVRSGYDSDIWLEFVHALKIHRGVEEAVSEVALRQRRLGQGPAPSDHAIAQAWEIVGKPGQAIQLLRRAVAAKPSNVVAANNLAMLLADDARELEQALQCIDKVLQQAGPVAEFLDTKGWILVQMDRAEEALPWLAEAAERATSDGPVAQLHLATAYMATGDHDRAREHLESARGGQLRRELLNTSEQRAWEMLQRKLLPRVPNGTGGDA